MDVKATQMYAAPTVGEHHERDRMREMVCAVYLSMASCIVCNISAGLTKRSKDQKAIELILNDVSSIGNTTCTCS